MRGRHVNTLEKMVGLLNGLGLKENEKLLVTGHITDAKKKPQSIQAEMTSKMEATEHIM